MLANVFAFVMSHGDLLVIMALLAVQSFLHNSKLNPIVDALKAHLPAADKVAEELVENALAPKPATSVAASTATKVAGALAMAMLVLVTYGCTKVQEQQVKTVEQVTEVVLADGEKICAEAQVLMGASEPAAIALACGIDMAAAKALQSVIDEQKAAVSLMVSESMKAGAPRLPACK